MATLAAKAASDATVIGESIVVRGDLQGDEDLTIRGRVEGAITLSKTLFLESSGVVKAEVKVRNAIISGVVVGNLTASDSVELTAECRMVGDINAPRVIIVEGASFRGRVDMGDVTVAAPRTGERPAARPQTVSRPQLPARPMQQASARAPVPPPRTAPTQQAAKVSSASNTPARRAPTSSPPRVPPSAAVLGAKRKMLLKRKR